MLSGGVERRGPGFGEEPSIPPIGPSPSLFGSPSTFSAAVNTNAGDYDKIMKSYDDLLKSGISSSSSIKPMQFNPIAPKLAQYSPSADVTSSMSNLSGLASSGGYSDEDTANIRARGLSPIRSIYANAQQNLNRQRSLQGGYSPNYTAASVKMARELSEQIGQRTTDLEAGIAQNKAANRLSIAPTWASAAQNENSARTAIEKSNADTINQINELNAQLGLAYGNANNSMRLQGQQGNLQTVEGMRALYGTSPALTSTFGNQVAQAGQLGQGQQQINSQKNQNMNSLLAALLQQGGA